MARWEQYEIWAMKAGKWEFIAAFLDFDLASGVFRNRTYRQKLLHVVYEGNSKQQEDVLAEVGSTRVEP